MTTDVTYLTFQSIKEMSEKKKIRTNYNEGNDERLQIEISDSPKAKSFERSRWNKRKLSEKMEHPKEGEHFPDSRAE